MSITRKFVMPCNRRPKAGEVHHDQAPIGFRTNTVLTLDVDGALFSDTKTMTSLFVSITDGFEVMKPLEMTEKNKTK